MRTRIQMRILTAAIGVLREGLPVEDAGDGVRSPGRPCPGLLRGAGDRYRRDPHGQRRGYSGRADQHPFELLLAVDGSQRRTTEICSARTNGFVGVNRTLLDECFWVTGRTTWYLQPAEIQRDLDRFLEYYNLQRTHRGYRLCGRTRGPERDSYVSFAVMIGGPADLSRPIHDPSGEGVRLEEDSIDTVRCAQA